MHYVTKEDCERRIRCQTSLLICIAEPPPIFVQQRYVKKLIPSPVYKKEMRVHLYDAPSFLSLKD